MEVERTALRKSDELVKLVDPNNGAGPFRVEIWIKGNLDKSLHFSNKEAAVSCYEKQLADV